MAKKVIPPIHASIQEENGSVAWTWYLFFQWIADNAGGADLSNYFTKEETEALLAAKADTDDLSDVAFSGDYDDLTNKPEIPAAQVNSDWNATSGVAEILNKPTIPTVNNATLTITQGGTTKGTFTANANSDVTIELDAGGDTSNYHPDLFDWKWADALRNDVQWLRADTFSWQQGSVYKAAYKHLRNDMFNWYSWENNGTTIYTKKAYPEVGEKVYSDSALTTEVGEITDVTDTLDITVEKITVNDVVYDSVSGSNIAPTTETVGGVTVQYIPAEDGHKIVTDFHESEVADVYTATGVAWYYIIDYGFKRFKLPRTKFGVTGLRDAVGNYVEPGLPNITGRSNVWGSNSKSGALKTTITGTAGLGGNIYSVAGNLQLDASKSNSIYGASTTVQPPATQMYLYFYVGEFTQTAIENTAGLNAELFNDKVDVGHEVIAFQAPTAGNNYTWYRKYADGWVEQGGIVRVAATRSLNSTINLPIIMSNNNYTISATAHSPARATYLSWAVMVTVANPTTTTFDYQSYGFSSGDLTDGIDWQVSGMAA